MSDFIQSDIEKKEEGKNILLYRFLILKKKKLAEMTINLNDYYLLKKYFAESNVTTNDQYEDF